MKVYRDNRIDQLEEIDDDQLVRTFWASQPLDLTEFCGKCGRELCRHNDRLCDSPAGAQVPRR